MPQSGGICVANHTTTLDAAILMQDRPYAILGQIHGGYLGESHFNVFKLETDCVIHVSS